MRRESESLEEAENITAAEMLRAMALYRKMEAAGIDVATGQPRPQAEPDSEPDEIPAVAEAEPEDATVTPIDAAQRKRTDGPRPA